MLLESDGSASSQCQASEDFNRRNDYRAECIEAVMDERASQSEFHLTCCEMLETLDKAKDYMRNTALLMKESGALAHDAVDTIAHQIHVLYQQYIQPARNEITKAQSRACETRTKYQLRTHPDMDLIQILVMKPELATAELAKSYADKASERKIEMRQLVTGFITAIQGFATATDNFPIGFAEYGSMPRRDIQAIYNPTAGLVYKDPAFKRNILASFPKLQTAAQKDCQPAAV